MKNINKWINKYKQGKQYQNKIQIPPPPHISSKILDKESQVINNFEPKPGVAEYVFCLNQ